MIRALPTIESGEVLVEKIHVSGERTDSLLREIENLVDTGTGS